MSFEHIDNLVDRHGVLFKHFQNTQPARLSQDLESPGNKFDHFAVDHRSFTQMDAGGKQLIDYIIIQEY